MERLTIEQATNDLIHVLGNFLLVTGEARAAASIGIPRMLSDSELGAYVIHHEPALRLALDNLRATLIRARLDEALAEQEDRERSNREAMDNGPRDEDCERYHQAKDDALTEDWN